MHYLPLSAFLYKGFKFLPNLCNGCHNVVMMFMNLNDMAILNILGVDYHCFINRISKIVAMGLLNSVNPNEKSVTL